MLAVKRGFYLEESLWQYLRTEAAIEIITITRPGA